MKLRRVYLLKADAFTGAQTKVQSINVVDPIQSLDFIIRMTTGSTMTESSVVKIVSEFTKIEIVDGADVLVSLSMKEAQALHILDMGRMPYLDHNLDDSKVAGAGFRLSFGLGPGDLKHYLDPTKFSNLQLKITNTFTAAAATSWAASGHEINVIANVIDEGAEANEGFLSARSMFSYTAVSGAVKIIDMPRDFPYRAILIQPLITTKRPDESISKVKLSCDADKYIPIEIDGDDLINQNIGVIGPLQQIMHKRITGAGSALSDLYYRVTATLASDTVGDGGNYAPVTAESVAVEMEAIAAGASATSAVESLLSIVLNGHCLHSSMYVMFGGLSLPESWFDAPSFSDVKLRLTGAAGVAPTTVVTQQLRQV